MEDVKQDCVFEQMPLLSAVLRAGVKITASVRPTGTPLRATRAALTLTPAAVKRIKVNEFTFDPKLRIVHIL